MQRTWLPLVMAIVAVIVASTPVLGASPTPSSHHQGPGPVNLGSPAAQLRIDLDRLLAEHAFLTIEQMRSGLTNAPDFGAAAKAVEANSTEIAAAIGSIYGDAAIEPFGDIWRSHIGFLVDYAVGLGKDDTAVQQTALSGLTVYRARLAKFLGDANPGIALGAIAEALDMHTAQLLEFIDTEHRGDHTAAYAIERTAYLHMFHVGDALAKVIANKFPKRFTGVDVAYSAAGALRVTLDRLLAEHAFLAAEAMRSGVKGAPDFDSAKQAIDGNSTDLQAVVAAAYGAQAGAAFRTLWDGHLSGYVAYIDATRINDPAARAQATNQLNTYAGQIAEFLAGANPYLNAGALSTLFQEHAGHLIGQVEAFAAADFDGTYALVRAGYAHMFTAGEALASGIATQLPDKFPATAGAPATDTVGGAVSHWPGLELLVLLAAVLVVAGAVGLAGSARLARMRRRRG